MQRNLILTILGLCLAATAFPQEKETQFAFNNYHRYYNEARQRGDAEKEKSIKAFRASFAQHPYRYHSLDTRLSAQECLAQLTADGIWFKGAGRAIPQRECLSEALLQPAGRNRLVRGGCLQPYLESSGCLS